jgi:glycosyltransferase involved in cell wall biosynthesis
MHALFAHDHVFTEHAGRFYSPGRLPYSSWNRYLQHFDTLSVLARVRKTDNPADIAGLQVADGPAVRVVGVPESHGVSRAFSLGAASAVADEQVRAADAVIARVPSDIGLLAARAGYRRGRILTVEVVANAWLSLWHHGSWLAKCYAPLLHAKTRNLVSKADFALYVTQEYLQEVYPCHGSCDYASNVVIGIEADALQQRLERIRQNANAIQLGFVGSLQANHKGLDTLLQAVAALRTLDLPVRLQVVGEGSLWQWQKMCRRLRIEDSVEFLGSLPGSAQVLRWLDQIDIYLHPSRAEGLPRSLIEAMSRGCCCLGSTVGGIPELLPAGDRHAPGDWRTLATLIEQAAMSAENRIAAARRNFTTAGSYDPQVLERRRNSFFGKVASTTQHGVGELTVKSGAS